MAVNQEQKADIGNRYVDEINRRIRLRTELQEKELAEANSLDLDSSSGFGSTHVEKVAKKLAAYHKLTAIGATTKNIHRGGRYTDLFRIYCEHNAVLDIPCALVADIEAIRLKRDKAKNNSKEMCMEIEFLTDSLAVGTVSTFQAHASRMWAPRSGDDIMPGPLFTKLVNDFLTSKRPAVCKLR